MIPCSQMLQAVSNVAPRGVYVCGNTTSTSGLTVSNVPLIISTLTIV
jgi:DNA replicative helicase MCM subunit Mcm2 (Cdc46/Mcm family)